MINALGSHLPGFVGSCFCKENVVDKFLRLKKIRSFVQLDGDGDLAQPIKLPGHEVYIVFVTHPSIFPANTMKRYNSKKVCDIELIRSGLKTIGLV